MPLLKFQPSYIPRNAHECIDLQVYENVYIDNTILYICVHLYRYVSRMEEERLPKEVMKWRPPGRRKRGRPKRTWANGISGLMGEKGLMEDDWNDRSNWRKKIL